MREELHNTDDLFRQAYQCFEEEPSPEAWSKLSTCLASQKVQTYRRRLAAWKIAALVLVLLLTGMVLYVSGILHNGGRPVTAATKDPSTVENHNRPLPDDLQSRQPHPKAAHKNEQHHTTGTGSTANGDPTQLVTERKFPEQTFERKQNNPQKRPANNHALLKKGSHRMRIDERPFIPVVPAKDNQLSNIEEPLATTERSTVSAKPINNQVALDLTNKIAKRGYLPALSDTFFSSATELRKRAFRPYWTATAFASFDRAGYRLDSDLPTASAIRQGEDYDLSFSGGVLVSRQFKAKWALQSGLVYSHSVISIAPQTMFAFRTGGSSVAYKYITSSGYAYVLPRMSAPPAVGDSLAAESGEHTLQHIILPVLLKFTAANGRRLSFTPGVGMAANFLTGTLVETEIADAQNHETVTITKLQGIKRFHWSVLADATLHYRLNSKTALSVQPSLRYALVPITERNEVETFPYAFGLGLGIMRRF